MNMKSREHFSLAISKEKVIINTNVYIYVCNLGILVNETYLEVYLRIKFSEHRYCHYLEKLTSKW